ncbi:MAG: hypothetical protein AAFO89_06400 [Planctomycetota bacterium]
MKALFTAVSVLAIVHLLAVVGFVGWFIGTGRVDDRRVAELSSMVAETTAARDAREAEEAAAADAEAAASEAVSDDIPLTAEQQIDRKLTLSEADRQVVQRMRREVEDLRRALAAERDLLDDQRSEFIAERDAFNRERERIIATEGDEQFQQVLATLKTMKSDLAHELLSTTIDQEAEGEDIAVAYLDNLPTRSRAKIIDEFNAQDPALAARLLERLRIRGTIAAADGRE